MSNYTQDKGGEALAYPKTLAKAVLLEENGESIRERLIHFLESEDVTATAICELDAAIKLIQSGTINGGRIMTEKDIANNLDGGKLILSGAQGKVIADYINRLEDTVATAICELEAYKAVARSIADLYYPHIYQEGDLAMQDGLLYRKNNIPIVTPEVFDPAKWTPTNVMAEIMRLLQNN